MAFPPLDVNPSLSPRSFDRPCACADEQRRGTSMHAAELLLLCLLTHQVSSSNYPHPSISTPRQTQTQASPPPQSILDQASRRRHVSAYRSMARLACADARADCIVQTTKALGARAVPHTPPLQFSRPLHELELLVYHLPHCLYISACRQ